jgi:transposase-like protein
MTHYPACTHYQSERLVNLPCRRLQCDEIWSYVGGKDKNLSEEKKQSGLGSIWTWTALDADTKLIASWLVGSRDAQSAYEFMQDAASRCAVAYSSRQTATGPIWRQSRRSSGWTSISRSW